MQNLKNFGLADVSEIWQSVCEFVLYAKIFNTCDKGKYGSSGLFINYWAFGVSTDHSSV